MRPYNHSASNCRHYQILEWLPRYDNRDGICGHDAHRMGDPQLTRFEAIQLLDDIVGEREDESYGSDGYFTLVDEHGQDVGLHYPTVPPVRFYDDDSIPF